VSLSKIPQTLRAAVAERDRGQCQYCHLLQVGQGAAFHVDHVWPHSLGGLTALDNLALQCISCSLHKSNKGSGRDPETGQDTPLFHPLRHVWSAHFSLLRDGACVGKTAIGRATIEALRMNDSMPKTARALQLILGLH
jgi:hypothetical protein